LLAASRRLSTSSTTPPRMPSCAVSAGWLNAERERSAEIEEGTPRAEREIQLEPRVAP